MSRRSDRLAGEVGVFMKQYGRQRQAGQEPNDRRYDPGVERRVRRMDPVELDALMRGDEDDDPEYDPYH